MAKSLKRKQKAPESLVKNAILEWFSYHPKKYLAWPNDSVGIWDPRGFYRKKNSKHHMNGVSDILFVEIGGRFGAIECKSKVGKLSSEQAAYLALVRSFGGYGIVARSLDDVTAVLDQ